MSKELEKIIEKVIKDHGPIPFSKFMELSLYYPGLGYYRKGYLPIGKGGDFYTSPCVHKIFGYTIGRQFVEFIEEFDEREVFLIEAGAGRGHLARDIGEYLKNKKISVKLIIIEPHKPFRDIQYKEVKDFYEDVIFLSGPEEMTHLKGIFYCNELFDSFPVEIVENRDNKIYQVYVDTRDGKFIELLVPASNEVLDFLKFWKINIPCGFRMEICPSALSFYKELFSKIKKGFSLIIDYGYTMGEFFESHRTKGTLMCYKNHLADENPYELVGEKDITAHINFSLFSRLGELLNFETVGFAEQQYFLIGAGILEEIEALQKNISQKEYEKEIIKIKNLFMYSMGYVFKFLCQKKDIKRNNFSGFSIKNYMQNL